MSRLVVDGYNIVHAWPDLARSLRRESLEEARRRLLIRLGEYRASTGNEVLVVFDARLRTLGSPDREVVEGVEVRYGSAREEMVGTPMADTTERSRWSSVASTISRTLPLREASYISRSMTWSALSRALP